MKFGPTFSPTEANLLVLVQHQILNMVMTMLFSKDKDDIAMEAAR